MDYSKKTVAGAVTEASKAQLLLQAPPVPSPPFSAITGRQKVPSSPDV